MAEWVVHCKCAPYDIYIGRALKPLHFGNPFSHQPGTLASVRVDSRAEAIEAFASWLSGARHQDVEPERRAWILKQLPGLRGKVLGCWCYPKACHGDVLAKLANK